ncbi:MAG TPA: dihydroorotase [bacterium]|nr:dihydroorotase [bacterium]
MNSQNQNKAAKESSLCLKGGRLVGAGDKDQQADIWIRDGVIQGIGEAPCDFKGRNIDCRGKIIIPGLFDMHVHLREPGFEDKETIQSGADAAMAGGFTGLACMPNTQPVIDNRAQIEFIRRQARDHIVDVHPIGAVSKGLNGKELTEMGDMAGAGAVAFSDDGKPVERSGLLKNALEYSRMLGRPVIDHCEDLTLSESGGMNEGAESTRLGLKGIPSISEDVMVARDLLVAEYTDGPLHIAHVSTAGSVRLIREAKARGVKVTAETCPHYLVLTEEAVREYNTRAKMKPPLRTEKDRKALVQGIQDGTLDVIATDHAPHTIDDKDTEFDSAAFGIIGLETALGVILTRLVQEKIIDIRQLVEKMSLNPRRILGLDLPGFKKGLKANFTVLDPEKPWVVNANEFLSRARNTPFNGWKLNGKAVGVVNGTGIWWNG